MLIINLFVLLTSGSILALLGALAWKIITNKLMIIRYRKLTRGFAELPTKGLLCDNTYILFEKNNCRYLLNRHREDKSTTGTAVFGGALYASTLDLDLIKKFIHDEPNDHLSRANIGLPFSEIKESLMLIDAKEWRHVRKMVGPALAASKFKKPNVVREIEQSINKLIDHIERRLANNAGEEEFDVNDFVHKFQLDLIFRCFYKQRDLIDFDDPNDHWSKVLEGASVQFQTNPFSSILQSFPILNPIVDWFSWHFMELGGIRKQMTRFVTEQAILGKRARDRLARLKEEAKKTGAEVDPEEIVLEDGTVFRRNMTDHIVDKFLEGELTKRQYVNNSIFILSAADKTATDCLVHTLYLLSVHQNVQDKLRGSITSDGAESEYLDWVLKESLRLLPPAPIGCSRTVTRDFELDDGHLLPAGTVVMTNAFVIHRLEKYWGEDAEEFRPERWRDTSHHHPCQYIPFGAGQRGCPGKAFALFEMKMLLVALFSRYKFECEPRDDAYEMYAPIFIFVIPATRTKVRIRRLTS